MCSQPDQVGINASQLVQQNPHPLRLRRNLKPEQLFDRQTVAKIIRERTEIIDSICERHHLLIKLRLAGLLDAGVQVTDVRHHPHHRFTINLKDQAQHAVCRRVLRPHVEDHGAILDGLERRHLREVGHS